MTALHRQAPAFQLEVRAPFLWRAANALLWMLSLAAAGAAVAAQAGERLGPGAALACGLLTLPLVPLAGWLAWRHRAGEVWQLSWDGQQWTLRPGDARTAAGTDAVAQSVELQLSLDLGGFLLLCCRPPDGTGRGVIYLPLSKRQHPGLWLPLRWALFSARRLPPDPA